MKPHVADRRWTARGRPRGSRDCASGFARSFTTHRSKPRDSNPEARTCITPRRTTRRTGSARAHPEHSTPCSGGKQPQPPRRARRARWANRADLRIRRPVTTTRVKEKDHRGTHHRHPFPVSTAVSTASARRARRARGIPRPVGRRREGRRARTAAGADPAGARRHRSDTNRERNKRKTSKSVWKTRGR